MVSSSVRSTRSRTPTRIVTPAVKAKAVTSVNKKSKTPPRVTTSTPKQASTSKKAKTEPKSAKRKATPKELFNIEEESPKKKQKVSKSTKKDTEKNTEKKSKATKTPKAKTTDTTDGKAKKKRVQKKDVEASITSIKSRAESPSKKSNTSLNGSLVSNTSSASLNETQPGNWGWFSCTVM